MMESDIGDPHANTQPHDPEERTVPKDYGVVGSYRMNATEQVIAAQSFMLGVLSQTAIKENECVAALKVLRDFALKGAALE